MQQAIQRLRWPADSRDLQTNKPLPILNVSHYAHATGQPASIQYRDSRRSRTSSSANSSPIPTISVDTSALYPPSRSRRASQYLSPSSISTTHHQKTAHQHASSRSQTRASGRQQCGRVSPLSTQHVIAVMEFLEQQECEMRAEVQRVAAQIRDLRQCVRAVKRGRMKAREGERWNGNGNGNGCGWEYSCSGSDADTEEVSAVVITAD